MKKRELVWIVALLFALYLWMGPVAAKRESLYPDYETLATIMDRVLDSYVDEADTEMLFRGAFDGIMSTLDPYSAYLPPANKQDLDINTTGEFGGLGIEITADERKVLKVETPLEGTPAFFAGVRPGDRIVAIDGVTTRPDPKMTRREIVMDAVSKLRGLKGTEVTIRVFHVDDRTYEDITIVRDIIKVKSIVAAKMVDEKAGIAYARMTQFQETTAKELDEAVEDLRTQGMKGLILDLRMNPGGLLNSAVDISDRFIDKGVIVSTRGRAAGTEHEFKASSRATYEDFPLAVLISGRSASASEILTGALQDHKRAVIIGMRSFGKASVQTIFPLENGTSAIKLTTGKYYTPSGRLIHRGPDDTEEDEWGIHPDIEIEMTFDEMLDMVDAWRKEHVIDQNKNAPNGAANPEDGEGDAVAAEQDDLQDLLGPAAETETGDEEAEKAEEKKPFVDRQLQAAVSVLRGAILERERLGK